MHISGRSEEVDELEESLLGLLGGHSSISNSTAWSIIDFKLFYIFSDFLKFFPADFLLWIFENIHGDIVNQLAFHFSYINLK